MSALYTMRYLGGVGIGMGAIYVGKGTVVGVDVTGGRYKGNYTDSNGRLKGTVTATFPSGAQLVTGMSVPPGGAIQLALDWPVNFANGQAQQVSVSGRPVQVTLEKIGDIP